MRCHSKGIQEDVLIKHKQVTMTVYLLPVIKFLTSFTYITSSKTTLEQ